MAWNLASAKEHLAEIVQRAESDGPQFLDLNGREAVILSAAEYRRLLDGKTADAADKADASDI